MKDSLLIAMKAVQSKDKRTLTMTFDSEQDKKDFEKDIDTVFRLLSTNKKPLDIQEFIKEIGDLWQPEGDSNKNWLVYRKVTDKVWDYIKCKFATRDNQED